MSHDTQGKQPKSPDISTGVDYDAMFQTEIGRDFLNQRTLLWPRLKLIEQFGISDLEPSTRQKVLLPKFLSGGDINDTKWVKSGMHEDMSLAFWNELSGWKEETRKKILIQGRALTPSMWEKMRDSNLYNFYYAGRDYRSDKDNQKSAIIKILPARLKDEIPQDVVKRWATLTFTPESMQETIGHKAVWYPAEFLYRYANEDPYRAVYKLQPILSAVNSFDVGSNDSPALVKMTKLRLEAKFNSIHSGAIYRTMQDKLKFMRDSTAAYAVEI